FGSLPLGGWPASAGDASGRRPSWSNPSTLAAGPRWTAGEGPPERQGSNAIEPERENSQPSDGAGRRFPPPWRQGGALYRELLQPVKRRSPRVGWMTFTCRRHRPIPA